MVGAEDGAVSCLRDRLPQCPPSATLLTRLRGDDALPLYRRFFHPSCLPLFLPSFIPSPPRQCLPKLPFVFSAGDLWAVRCVVRDVSWRCYCGVYVACVRVAGGVVGCLAVWCGGGCCLRCSVVWLSD